MMTLLIIRDRIASVYQKGETYLNPLFRFLFSLLVFYSWHYLFGYSDIVYTPLVIIGVSLVCSFVSDGLRYLALMLVAFVDLLAMNVETAALFAAVIVLIYLFYSRMSPKHGWLILLTMVFFPVAPAFPILIAGICVGVSGFIPVECGLLLYFFSIHAREIEPMLTSNLEKSDLNPVSYMIEKLSGDDQFIMYVVIAAVVVVVALVHRSTLKYAQFMSIVLGAVLFILLTLSASLMFGTEIAMSPVLLGTVTGAGAAVVVQFFRGILDYTHVEKVRFEDDDYYYIVRAIPKMKMPESEVNVKKINVRRTKQRRTVDNPTGREQE